MTRWCLILSAVAVLGFGFASCGGGASNGVAAKQYVSQVNAAQRRLAAAIGGIAAPNAGSAVWARSVRAIRDLVRKLADDLAAIKPPAAVAAAHAQLVAIVRRYASRLDAAARTAKDRARLPRAKAQLLSAFTDANSAFTTTISRINSALR